MYDLPLGDSNVIRAREWSKSSSIPLNFPPPLLLSLSNNRSKVSTKSAVTPVTMTLSLFSLLTALIRDMLTGGFLISLPSLSLLLLLSQA